MREERYGTKVGYDPDNNRQRPFNNLCFTESALDPRTTQFRGEQFQLTKIHDHPLKPLIPSIYAIPYANRPENAPAMEAAPKKDAMRVWYMYRGYHRERLGLQ